MAIVLEFEDLAGWEDWLSHRPAVIQEMCKRYPPDRLYLMQPYGKRVTISSYNENGTVAVFVSAHWNTVIIEQRVFDVDPEHLVECDEPDESECGFLPCVNAADLCYN